MKPTQIAIAVAAVVAVAIFAIASSGGGGGKGGSGGTTAPKGALAVSFAYSPEKEKLLKPLIQKFNERGEKVAGKPVFIEGQSIASGAAEDKLRRGRLEPVVWSPASSLWGRQLNFEADSPYAPTDNSSIVRTPLVIAMWEPMARALGWPRKQV